MSIRFYYLFITLAFFLFTFGSIQAQHFTWKKGAAIENTVGVYGQLGVAGPSNTPGARVDAVTWKDGAGNFWMFGGAGYDYIGNSGQLNDLWKYNPTTNEWTWMSGSDIFIQLGKYGIQGTPTATTCPGARTGALGWADANGNLWLFGGYGYSSVPAVGMLNDLWKYNMASGLWTWVSGSDINDQAGTYGIKGTGSPANMPGGRYISVAWQNSGKFWLHGGLGFTTGTFSGFLNDLWQYDPLLNQWTWMSGDSITDANGNYGTQGSPSSTNKPGARHHANSWTDNAGNFWLFGGKGYDAVVTSTVGYLNDLWKYNTNANQWTWIKGSSNMNQGGAYGTLSVGSSSTQPGSRFKGTTWMDAAGNFWLMGGYGHVTSTVNSGFLNDLWKYNATSNQWTWIKGANTLNVSGSYGAMGTASPGNIPGGRTQAMSWIDSSNGLWLFGGGGKSSSGNSGLLNDLWHYKNCHIAPLSLTITTSDSIICKGESAILGATGSNNFTWSTGTFSSGIVITPTAPTTYTVYSSDAAMCVYSATFTQNVLPCAGISGGEPLNDFNLFPNPGRGTFMINAPIKQLVFWNSLGQRVLELSELPSNQVITTGLPNGLYHYGIVTDHDIKLSGKLLVADQ